MNFGLIVGRMQTNDRSAALRPVDRAEEEHAAASAALAYTALVAALTTEPNAAWVRKETLPASFAASSGVRLSSSNARRSWPKSSRPGLSWGSR